MSTRLRLALVCLLGALLLAPTVGMGFYADDYLHQAVLADSARELPMRPWSLFDFGVRADWRSLEGRVGGFPWWTQDGWRVRFWRPVSSLALWGQHALFGRWAPGYHLVGLGLFVFLLVRVHRLYRTLGLGESTSLLGTLLLAVSPTAVLPAGWPANLNTLLVALGAVLSFELLLRPGRVSTARLSGALLLAAAAALAKESGLVALLLFALLCGLRAREPGPERARLRAGALLAAALAAGFCAWLVLGGYGTNSLFYATPWSDPARFAANLLALATGGVAGLAGPFPLDAVQLFPAYAPVLLAAGALLGWPLAVWVGRTVRALSGAGWLGLWTLLFLGVQAGAMPSLRLLFVPAIGGAGLLACFLVERRRLALAGRTRRLGRVATRVVLVSATVGAGLLSLAQSFGVPASARFVRERALATEVGPRSLGHRDLLVLQPATQFQAFTLHTTWAGESDDHDLTFHLVQGAPRAARWTRTGTHTFELESLAEPFFGHPFEDVYRTGAVSAVGDRYHTGFLEAEVLAVSHERPTRVAFTCARSLDDPAVRFLVAENARLVHVPPPVVGESRELATPTYDGPYLP